MDTWQHVWRTGIAPQLSTAALLALRAALVADDPRLLQGATCTPPPMHCVLDWPAEAACVVGYAGWQGEGLATVGAVEEFFAAVCFEADQRLGEPAAIRYFLNWTDDTPRDEMRAALLAEVELALVGRPLPAVVAAA